MFFSSELASDGLKGRVFEVSLADLQNDEVAFRKFRLIAEDINGKNVLTNFHGMTLTTDKLKSLVKKWQVSFMKILPKSHMQSLNVTAIHKRMRFFV